MSKIKWVECQEGGRWASECGVYFIAHCENLLGAGCYYELRWLGCYGQTCRREYGALGDGRRAATMRFRSMEVLV